MSWERRADLVIGIILLLIGGWFLAAQFNLVPQLNEIINIQFQWPLIVVGVGLLLFIMGLISRSPGMSVPACIVGGIGGILYYTSLTGNWGAWTYLWTLIPGFVGIGIIIATLLGSSDRSGYREGLRLVLISAILFVVFFLLLSGQGLFAKYWPILIILAGIWIIITAFWRKK
jgi:hypothetical protein